MADLMATMADGLPLTAAAILAVIVILAWLFGGIGSQSMRLSLGLPWLAALVIGWTLMLYRADGATGQSVVVANDAGYDRHLIRCAVALEARAQESRKLASWRVLKPAIDGPIADITDRRLWSNMAAGALLLPLLKTASGR